jgi:hypothetical protein
MDLDVGPELAQRRIWVSGERDDLVAAVSKGARQREADQSGGTGDDHSHCSHDAAVMD